MKLKDEEALCKQWITEDLHFREQHSRISVFETTIRVLGGLLSAHALTHDDVYLNKAKELADILIVAFESPNGLPFDSVKISTRSAHPVDASRSSVAEVGSLQLEWRYLSILTGDPKYAAKVDAVTNLLASVPTYNGLFTRFISLTDPELRDTVVTLGARVDSLYEYFLKAWLMSGKTDDFNLKLYVEHIERIVAQLFVRTSPSGYLYVQELKSGIPEPKMDHLVCFLAGTMALAAKNIPQRRNDLSLAEELTESCYRFYNTTTGLAPEIVRVEAGRDFIVDPGAKHNLLRPEVVESLFVMWRLTHDQKYRDWGWDIFLAFKRMCRVPSGGYSGLHDVTSSDPLDKLWNDHMESFFLAETLKYLYLLFDDDTTLPLHKWVFNTEAHPFPIQRDAAPVLVDFGKTM